MKIDPKIRELDNKLELSDVQTKWQRKNLTADVTTNSTMTELSFNNLEVGKTYKWTINLDLRNENGDANTNISVFNGGTRVGLIVAGTAASGLSFMGLGNSNVFTATDTTLTFEVDSISNGSYVVGNEIDRSYAILEELPNHTETTDWT